VLKKLDSLEQIEPNAAAAELAGRPEPGACPVGEPYSLRVDSLSSAGPSLLSQWQSFHDQFSPDDHMNDADWLRGYFEGETDHVRFYSLFQGDRLCGLAPFLWKQWPLSLRLGEWKIAEFPLKRLRLLGSTLCFPDDEAAYDLIFRELAKDRSRIDALSLEEIPLDSFLWKYLHQSELIRKSFLNYEPDPPSRRLLLRFEGTFEQYMGKFSSKHRKNLSREVKRVRDGALGEMRLMRFESPEEAPAFLEQAFDLSRKTYQWTLYQRGLSAVELIRKRVLFAAERGWLRSYLLDCGGRVCAFLLGFQYRGRFLLHEIGFDPTLAKYSIGTVLQLLAIEDMFTYHRPRILDFETYGKYKEVLSTESFPQGKLLLFRRGAYTRLLRAGHRGCEGISRSVSSLFERLNLKTALKRKLRGWSGSQ
jgi:hypothetical protein